MRYRMDFKPVCKEISVTFLHYSDEKRIHFSTGEIGPYTFFCVLGASVEELEDKARAARRDLDLSKREADTDKVGFGIEGVDGGRVTEESVGVDGVEGVEGVEGVDGVEGVEGVDGVEVEGSVTELVEGSATELVEVEGSASELVEISASELVEISASELAEGTVTLETSNFAWAANFKSSFKNRTRFSGPSLKTPFPFETLSKNPLSSGCSGINKLCLDTKWWRENRCTPCL